MNNFYDTAKDFVSPISIAATTLVIGYFITRRIDSQKAKVELHSKRVTLIDTILIEIERLNSILETLRLDAERNMFMFKNTDSAKPSIVTLQKIFDEVTIFPDGNLRKRILVDIDLVNSLLNDIVSIENYALLEGNKFTEKENQSLKELRSLKLALLKKNIGFDPTMNPFLLQGETPPLSDNKKRAIKESYDVLNNDFLNARNQLSQAELFCKDKRVFYCMRIIDVQAKLRELGFMLNEERDHVTTN